MSRKHHASRCRNPECRPPACSKSCPRRRPTDGASVPCCGGQVQPIPDDGLAPDSDSADDLDAAWEDTPLPPDWEPEELDDEPLPDPGDFWIECDGDD